MSQFNNEPKDESSVNDVPLGQRLLERPFLLLAAGLIVMFAFYTGWGIWEIVTLPPSSLP